MCHCGADWASKGARVLQRFVERDVDRVAVVDVETTGLYNKDRVLEVGIVLLTPDGKVVERWETLIQPHRDVGPAGIHRITASMLQHAPSFADVAGDIITRLDGAVFAGHNTFFDRRLLRHELMRLDTDMEFPAGTLDSLHLAGSGLSVACAEHGVSLTDHHRALADAEASAQLLLKLAATDAMTPQMIQHGPVGPARVTGARHPAGEVVLTRDQTDAPTSLPTPPEVLRLARQVPLRGLAWEMATYLDVLHVALADLHLDQDERDV